MGKRDDGGELTGRIAGKGGARPVAEHAVARILAESASFAAAASPLLEAIAETLGWRMGAIWAVDDEAAVLRFVQAWRAPNVEAEAFEETSRSISFAPGVGLPGRVWASGEPAWIADLTKDRNFPRSQAAQTAGLRSAFAFPITSGQRTFGVIEFFTHELHPPDTALLQTMTALGSQIGQYVERMRAEEEVRRSEAIKGAIVESALDCVITIDHEGHVTEFNPAAEATFGYTRDEAIGTVLAELIIPPSLRERHNRALARYLATEQPRVLDRRLELTGMHRDGSEFPVELTVTRIGEYEPPMFAGYVRDITDRRRNEQELRFLADASAVLDSSLELDATLRNVARLAIPHLADASILYLCEDGEIRRVGAAAADPSIERALDALGRFPVEPDGAHPAARAIKEGKLQVVPDVSEALLQSIAKSTEHLESLQKAPDPGRGVVVPLRLRRKVLGAITFAYLQGRRGPDQQELALMEEVGRRAATAIDNARLFTESMRAARTLQGSLLPSQLPVIPGLELAAQFRPAQDADKGIGGDFYDVFEASGHWVVAIGDSYGKGMQAATTTALARFMLRAAATRERDPAQILRVLNDVLRWETQEPQFCTVALGIVEREGDEASISLACGGHPLPLVLRSDGQVGPIGAPGTLLGVVSNPSLGSERLRLRPGDAVVFYTDGLIEGRTREAKPDFDLLTATIQSCAGLGAEAIGERIDRNVAARRGEDASDDAAVLVVRLLDPNPNTAVESLRAPAGLRGAGGI